MADYTRPINSEVTFTATDNTLTSHTWKVNNVIKSTSNPFIYTFNEAGTFTIRHEGSSPGGSCVPIEKTIEITPTPTPPTPRTPPCDNYGDVDDDGYVTKTDSLWVIDYVYGRRSFTDEQKRRADVNDDGDITMADATLIAGYAAGTYDTFPVCKKVPPKLGISTAIIAGAVVGLGVLYYLTQKNKK